MLFPPKAAAGGGDSPGYCGGGRAAALPGERKRGRKGISGRQRGPRHLPGKAGLAGGAGAGGDAANKAAGGPQGLRGLPGPANGAGAALCGLRGQGGVPLHLPGDQLPRLFILAINKQK